MVTRNLGKVQEALDALNPVQRNIIELNFYKNTINSPNHSGSQCSSVRSMIDTLSREHSEVVNALIAYGTNYQIIDESLAKSNNPNYQSTGALHEFSYFSADEHQKEFWKKTWNQIILGDFSDDITWLGTTASIGAALLGIDAPMDVRDFIANISKGEWGWAIVSGVSLLPVIGVLCKLGKAADVADSVSDVGRAVKQGGSYADLKKISDSAIEQVHHMPANSISPLSYGEGPAIIMKIEDHFLTKSFGNKRGAKAFRLKQQELIQDGKFLDALKMDIDDITNRFGDKYNAQISDTLEYVNNLIKDGKIK